MRKFVPGFVDPEQGIITGFGGYQFNLICEGKGAPPNSVPGYQTGAIWAQRDGTSTTALWVNVGNETSSTWVKLSAGIQGVTAGWRFAMGQIAVTGTSTVVTGLTLVQSALANMDDDPVVDPEMAKASIGDQAGTPAAGSIILSTWKTFGGTPAAGTVAKKVNWMAIGL